MSKASLGQQTTKPDLMKNSVSPVVLEIPELYGAYLQAHLRERFEWWRDVYTCAQYSRIIRLYWSAGELQHNKVNEKVLMNRVK